MAVHHFVIGGGVIAAVASVTVGLYAGGVINTEKERETEPGGHSLSEDTGYLKADKSVSDTYSGKYGKTYGIFLVGVAAKNGEDDKNNDTGGDGSFKYIYQDKNTKKIKGFKDGITDGKTLKEACQKAYKGTLGDNKEITENSIIYKEEDVGKFCSTYAKKEIKVLNDMGNEEKYSTSTYGDSNKSDLVATKATSNKANERFGVVKTEELKNDSTVNTATTNEFKKLQNRLKGEQSNKDSQKDNLRETCQLAYAETNNENKYPKNDIFKFCSLSGKAPS